MGFWRGQCGETCRLYRQIGGQICTGTLTTICNGAISSPPPPQPLRCQILTSYVVYFKMIKYIIEPEHLDGYFPAFVMFCGRIIFLRKSTNVFSFRKSFVLIPLRQYH